MISVCQSVVTIVLIWIATAIKAGTARGSPSCHWCSPSLFALLVVVSGAILALVVSIAVWVGGLSIIGAGPLGMAIFIYPALSLSESLLFGHSRDSLSPLSLVEGTPNGLAEGAAIRGFDQVSTVEETSRAPLLSLGGVHPTPALLEPILSMPLHRDVDAVRGGDPDGRDDDADGAERGHGGSDGVGGPSRRGGGGENDGGESGGGGGGDRPAGEIALQAIRQTTLDTQAQPRPPACSPPFTPSNPPPPPLSTNFEESRLDKMTRVLSEVKNLLRPIRIMVGFWVVISIPFLVLKRRSGEKKKSDF